jgi:hypothetical protein
MSTRANIVLSAGQLRVYLYRHCDGYLAEAGADILAKLGAAVANGGAYPSPERAADAFLRAMFADMYEKQSYEKAARPVYELTSDLHGDIEHAYFIQFSGAVHSHVGVTVRHAARVNYEQDLAKWTSTGKPVSLDEFAEAVNKDRRAANVRIRELKASSNAYAECEEYEMVKGAQS